MTSIVTDMTTGNPTRLLLTFSLPMLAGNLFQQFYTMIASAIMWAPDALAAVGATGSVLFLFYSLCSGMSVGIGIVVSQYLGAKDEDNVKRSIANSIYVMLAAALLVSLLGFFFARPVLQLLQTPGNIIGESELFLKTNCVGILAVSAYDCISSLLRSLGDSTTPLIFLTISIAVNIGLDFLFVLGFSWGVFGTVLATIIAQGIAALGCLFFAFRKNPHFRIPKRNILPQRQIIRGCVQMGPSAGAAEFHDCRLLSCAAKCGKFVRLRRRGGFYRHKPLGTAGAAAVQFPRVRRFDLYRAERRRGRYRKGAKGIPEKLSADGNLHRMHSSFGSVLRFLHCAAVCAGPGGDCIGDGSAENYELVISLWG